MYIYMFMHLHTNTQPLCACLVLSLGGPGSGLKSRCQFWWENWWSKLLRKAKPLLWVFAWMVTAADKQVYESECEQVNETSFVKCFEELVLLKNRRPEKHYISASPNPVEGFPSKTWQLFALLSQRVCPFTLLYRICWYCFKGRVFLNSTLIL